MTSTRSALATEMVTVRRRQPYWLARRAPRAAPRVQWPFATEISRCACRAIGPGLVGKIADAVNDVVSANEKMAEQLERVGPGRRQRGQDAPARALSRGRRAPGSRWKRSLNTLMDDLLWPTTEVTRALAAVAQGDLSQNMRLDVDGRPLQGEFLRSATIVNSMIKQLGVFTSEVTRVAREVGTDGKLGGQAEVPDVSGVWRDLTDSVNSMASNLTGQVRNISEVTIAVASGDLSKKITVDVRGEILQLKDAINTMVDQLRSFAVRGDARRARGRHRGQARRPGHRARRRRHLEGFDRLGERHVRQPHRSGAQHCAGDHGRRARRPFAQDHRATCAARSSS